MLSKAGVQPCWRMSLLKIMGYWPTPPLDIPRGGCLLCFLRDASGPALSGPAQIDSSIAEPCAPGQQRAHWLREVAVLVGRGLTMLDLQPFGSCSFIAA